MEIKCKECGHVKRTVEQPFIVLSSGKLPAEVKVDVIGCDDVNVRMDNPDEMREYGKQFGKWWNGNVAGGFVDGFNDNHAPFTGTVQGDYNKITLIKELREMLDRYGYNSNNSRLGLRECKNMVESLIGKLEVY